jgi:hypothetical protein
MITMHMRIVHEGQLVVDLPEWPHPIPRVGDYIFHPPTSPGTTPDGIAGCVRQVIWRTHDRTGDGKRFMMADEPYVELVL